MLPATITYNALISACEKGKHPERALKVFEAMEQQGVVSNAVTCSALISACEKGKQGWPAGLAGRVDGRAGQQDWPAGVAGRIGWQGWRAALAGSIGREYARTGWQTMFHRFNRTIMPMTFKCAKLADVFKLPPMNKIFSFKAVNASPLGLVLDYCKMKRTQLS